jgi:alpha/beta hydrolase family protein
MASPDRPTAGAYRVADVALRDLAPHNRARVRWPAPCADPTVAALVVLFCTDDDLVGELMARLGAVVLTVSAAHAFEALAVLSWAADHAVELGVDAGRIAVVGDGAGAALAERVAELAVDDGWPPLRHVALIWPHDHPAAALDGLTRALAVPTRQPSNRSAR